MAPSGSVAVNVATASSPFSGEFDDMVVSLEQAAGHQEQGEQPGLRNITKKVMVRCFLKRREPEAPGVPDPRTVLVVSIRCPRVGLKGGISSG